MCAIFAEVVIFAYTNILNGFHLSEWFVCHEPGRRFYVGYSNLNMGIVGFVPAGFSLHTLTFIKKFP